MTEHSRRSSDRFERGGERKKLRTGVSQVFWCSPSSPDTAAGAAFQPAHFPLGSGSGDQRRTPNEIWWFDELLDDGFALPGDHDNRAVTVLITGPPGTGKTTLATELAYRWAHREGKRALYVSTESHAPWLIANARSYRWEDVDTTFTAIDKLGADARLENGKVSVYSLEPKAVPDTANSSKSWIDPLYALLVGSDAKPDFAQTAALQADIVVVDSLNTLHSRTDQSQYFQHFKSHIANGPELAIMILDSAGDSKTAEFWEFQSDTVIRLDWTRRVDYRIRTIEVVKARYQQHAWGPHQLKIYEPSPRDGSNLDRAMRQHPFREEGGIFIYPSVHFLLSRYKRETHFAGEAGDLAPCLIENLHQTLLGFPRGRCTAFLGSRGGHKSHLGLMQVLAGIVRDENAKEDTKRQKALIVSLRDDEGLTNATMQSILDDYLDESETPTTVEELVRQNRAEIMYFPPGYITPEEFLHRVLTSVHRLKSDCKDAQVSLLFNSLDQLAPRFPLCADELIFIPALIQLLNGEGVTSYFVSAADPGSDDHGLGSIAELILEFRQQLIPPETFNNLAVGESGQKAAASTKRRSVVLRISRFAGGQTAGAEGVLELVGRHDAEDGSSIFSNFRSGLHYFPDRTGVLQEQHQSEISK